MCPYTWDGTDRRSERSRLARSVIEAKAHVQGYQDEIRRTPRRRFRRRSELEQAMEAARERERNLLVALGAKDRW
jgi:hypothetical protein